MLLASIPVCYALGVLTVWQLYAVALATGAFGVLFTVCQPTLFVSLVPDDAYLEGNSLLYGSRAGWRALACCWPPRCRGSGCRDHQARPSVGAALGIRAFRHMWNMNGHPEIQQSLYRDMRLGLQSAMKHHSPQLSRGVVE